MSYSLKDLIENDDDKAWVEGKTKRYWFSRQTNLIYLLSFPEALKMLVDASFGGAAKDLQNVEASNVATLQLFYNASMHYSCK